MNSWLKNAVGPCASLCGCDVDNALFKLNGIKTEKEINQEERSSKPLQCERCSEVNPPTNKFSASRGAPS